MVTYIRDNIQHLYFSIDNIHNDIEYIACKIYKGNKTLNLISIYVAPNFRITKRDFDTLFYANSYSNNLLITGDFNGHNELWSLKTPDYRGNYIRDSLVNYDLNILNSCEKYTRSDRDGNEIKYSSPDISIATSDLSLELVWDTLDFRGSDHKPISIIYKQSNLKFDRVTRRFGLNKIIWEKFMDNNLSNFDYEKEINDENFEEEYTNFINAIYKSLEESGGKMPKATSNNNNVNVSQDKEPPGILW